MLLLEVEYQVLLVNIQSLHAQLVIITHCYEKIFLTLYKR